MTSQSPENEIQFKTPSAEVVSSYQVRVQIPPENVEEVIQAVLQVDPLEYGDYQKVAFRHRLGTQQFEPMVNACSGKLGLIQIPCDEVSFVVPDSQSVLSGVVEAVFCSHPYEEPVIQIQPILSTRLRAGAQKDNPKKWWNRSALQWVSPTQRAAMESREECS